MAKVVDITEKLSFDENPIIRIKGEELEVQSDAENMLKMLGTIGGGKNELQAAKEALELLFNEKDRKKLEKLKLQIKDYIKVIEMAIDIAMGEDESQGEQ